MRILLAVCGSISAYKAIDLARSLVKNGHEVKVVLTKGAEQFVVPNVFTYLGVKNVYTFQDDFKNTGVLHVELARWCEKLVIAPLSANTLSRLVEARANDLLSSLFLALEKNIPILVFPAMNSEMLTHPFVIENFEHLKKLKSLSNIFIAETKAGLLACNDEGKGKLLDVEVICDLIESVNLNSNRKNILITTGATVAPLDPVRYLTNSSSGITGYYLAKSFLAKGYNVTIVAGMNSSEKLNLLSNHPHYQLLKVKTVDDMFNAVHAHINQCDIFIAAAAVNDVEFNYSDEKIKKDQMENTISVKPAKDILKSVIDFKKSKKQNLKIVGFAAETNLSEEILLKKFNSKPVELLIGTKVHNALVGEDHKNIEGFNNSSANYKLMKDAKIIFEGNISKEKLAEEILQRI